MSQVQKLSSTAPQPLHDEHIAFSQVGGRRFEVASGTVGLESLAEQRIHLTTLILNFNDCCSIFDHCLLVVRMHASTPMMLETCPGSTHTSAETTMS